jgi:hypothetical protein
VASRIAAIDAGLAVIVRAIEAACDEAEHDDAPNTPDTQATPSPAPTPAPTTTGRTLQDKLDAGLSREMRDALAKMGQRSTDPRATTGADVVSLARAGLDLTPDALEVLRLPVVLGAGCSIDLLATASASLAQAFEGTPPATPGDLVANAAAGGSDCRVNPASDGRPSLSVGGKVAGG